MNLEVIRERFAQKYQPITESGCWIWTGAQMAQRYGSMNVGGRKTDVAHRISWRLFKGEIPDGMHVCHSCDVRECVNPNHLFLGTNLDNILDSVKKGRRKGITRNRPTGLKYVMSGKQRRRKFDDSIRQRVLADRATGMSQHAIALRYGMSQPNVHRILHYG